MVSVLANAYSGIGKRLFINARHVISVDQNEFVFMCRTFFFIYFAKGFEIAIIDLETSFSWIDTIQVHADTEIHDTVKLGLFKNSKWNKIDNRSNKRNP